MATSKREPIGTAVSVEGATVAVALDMSSEAARHVIAEAAIASAVDIAEEIAAMAAEEPLNAMQTWCVHLPDWRGGKPVVATDSAGVELRGLTRAEAVMAVRVLGDGCTAVRES